MNNLASLHHALKNWRVGHRPLLGLDFDGTLVGLNPDPDKVYLSAESLALLDWLAKKSDLALISGRSLDDLRHHVPIENAHFIGNHGCQLLKKDGTLWTWTSPEWKNFHSNRLPELGELVQKHGGWIEDKTFSLTIHYRGAADESWWQTQGQVALEEFTSPIAHAMEGKKCWNILPHGAPNKGITTMKLCRETGHDSLIYFGDEATDETVFSRHELAIFGVKVGNEQTLAAYRVPGPAEVLEFIKLLALESERSV